MTAADTIDAFLDSRGVMASRPDPETWVFQLSGNTAKWFVQITLVEEFDQVLVYAELPVTVPPPQREALATWAARANRGLPVGNFEVDVDEGGVWCKTSVDVEGTELSEALLHNMVATNNALTDRYLGPLQRWIQGDLDGPEEAVMAAEGFEP